MRNVVRALPLLLLPLFASCTHNPYNVPLDVSILHTPIKVACVGDSITEGHGLGDNTYPEQLQRMLGDNFQVHNFGVSGATLLNHGDKPYTQQGAYKQSLDFKPDVVIIMLGTNDSKPQNWQYKSEFETDYHEFVKVYQKLESKPRIWLVYPCPVPSDNKYKIREAPVDEECAMITRTARFRKVGVIDVHAPLVSKPEDFPDYVHPNTDGANIMAATIFEGITGNAYKGPSVIKEPITTP